MDFQSDFLNSSKNLDNCFLMSDTIILNFQKKKKNWSKMYYTYTDKTNAILNQMATLTRRCLISIRRIVTIVVSRSRLCVISMWIILNFQTAKLYFTECLSRWEDPMELRWAQYFPWETQSLTTDQLLRGTQKGRHQSPRPRESRRHLWI